MLDGPTQRWFGLAGVRWQRVVALAVMMAMHAAMLVFLTVPPSAADGRAMLRKQVKSGVEPVLRVRFIDSRAVSSEQVLTRQHLDLPRSDRHEVKSSRTTPRLPPRVARRRAETNQTPTVSPRASRQVGELDLGILDGRPVFGAGRGKNVADAPNIRVPGGGKIPDALRFHIVDPRSQGIAGVIHFIGGLAGAVDPHCLDLDAWRGMSIKERAAHGVSPRDIQDIEDHYNCAQYRRR